MSAKDRERSFENALASHLRADGSAAAQRSACADAELLAAFHEGSLAPEQVTLLKMHRTGCSRCQEILAQLEAMEEIPVAAANIMPEAMAAAKTGVRVLPVRRPTVWRWMAPAGALAAALLVWVAVHENSLFSGPAKAPTLDAKRAEIAKDLSSSRSPVTPPTSGDAAQIDKARSSQAFDALPTAPPSNIAGVPKKLPQLLLKRKDLSSAREKSAASESFDQLADSPLTSRVTPNVGTSAEVAKNQGAKTDAKPESKEKAANATIRVRREAPSADSLQPASEPGAMATAASAAPPAPVLDGSMGGVLSESAPVSGRATQQQETSPMPRYRQQVKVRLANSIGEVTVSAPNGQASWRVGQAGVIEFSADAGKTWTLQPSGVITDLLGGSAASDKVCWIVGRAGTILRTIDGGAHWQKIRPPIQDDFRSVFAVDARQATVSPANGKYQTIDGGITWQKLPPE
jgi:hypothetical protein